VSGEETAVLSPNGHIELTPEWQKNDVDSLLRVVDAWQNNPATLRTSTLIDNWNAPKTQDLSPVMTIGPPSDWVEDSILARGHYVKENTRTGTIKEVTPGSVDGIQIGGITSSDLYKKSNFLLAEYETLVKTNSALAEKYGPPMALFDNDSGKLVGMYGSQTDYHNTMKWQGLEGGRMDYSRDFAQALCPDGSLKPRTEGFTQTGEKGLYMIQIHADTDQGMMRTPKYWTIPGELKSLDDVRDYVQKMALPPNWGDRTQITIAYIPPKTTVDGLVRIAEPKTSKTGEIYSGGGKEILLREFDPAWMIETRKLSEGLTTDGKTFHAESSSSGQ